MPPKTKPESSHITAENAAKQPQRKGILPTETAHRKAPVSPAKLKAALKQDAADAEPTDR